MSKLAILYQASNPPSVGLTKKPMKPGGYKDSGADIAFTVSTKKDIPIVTPKSQPSPSEDYDWVFPDTSEGIQSAYDAGARIFWLNTTLYNSHPIEKWFGKGLEFVGQTPQITDKADDKFTTNQELRSAGLFVADSELISDYSPKDRDYPMVIKPVRGRGSQGVQVIHSEQDLKTKLERLKSTNEFGSEFILEEMLPGEEITITVMPPGEFEVGGAKVIKENHWALPPVLRFNHHDGIAPYNGLVAVTENSRALTADEISHPEVQKVLKECERAAQVVKAKAPIRVDCRQNSKAEYKLFDLNVKPNMTGAGRPGREAQDCLSAISARAMGWSYADLLAAMLSVRWTL